MAKRSGMRRSWWPGSPASLSPRWRGSPRRARSGRSLSRRATRLASPYRGQRWILSGTRELLRGETNEAGYVILQTFPPDARSYMLTIEKMGYARTTTEVRVGWLKLYLPLVLRNR